VAFSSQSRQYKGGKMSAGMKENGDAPTSINKLGKTQNGVVEGKGRNDGGRLGAPALGSRERNSRGTKGREKKQASSR